MTLLKIPKSFVWGSVPSAVAGVAFGTPQSVTLAVNDADGNPIVGGYSTAVSVSDSDASTIGQGSALVLNGGATAKNVSISQSGFALAIAYGGLAIASATLAATATGATTADASFTPALANIVYSGPTVNANPEIDLYNPSSAQAGYSAQFDVTQAGWKDATFSNAFTYALGGSNNNCTSFAVSPASGTSNTYTVAVAATPAVGTCTLAVTGGAGVQALVTLTYTTTGIGVNVRRGKPGPNTPFGAYPQGCVLHMHKGSLRPARVRHR